MPSAIFLLLPFETVWMRARAGTLRAGDQAPDFKLPALDKSAEVELASLRGQKPVVLVFGSYT
jgi:peroxiredoxin